MDYKSTLNMPRTDFDMRANLPAKEPQMIQWWDEIDVYGMVQASRRGRKQFILHDGPPYANGDIHLGTALNKILKDFVVKYATMAGYDSPYVPGWDCHGLPIELRTLRDLGIDRHTITPLELRQKCAEAARHWVDVQRTSFKRLGVRGDWLRPYMTLQPEYEAKQIEVFAAMAMGGHLYRGLRPVYWCGTDETALADAEVEYREKTSHAIYVAFPVTDGKGQLPAGARIVIWTTTPWTLPGNLAIALNPNADYGLYATDKGELLVAQNLAAAVFEATGIENRGLQAAFKGRDLERAVTRHPFLERDSLVILGDHVTTEDGTGCVHTAPGHGHEDFWAARQYGLEPLVPIDSKGVFTAAGGKFMGMDTETANAAIIAELQSVGALLKDDTIRHQFAHCWRCQNPLIYRATVQWFTNVQGFMHETLRAIDTVRWVPAWGKNRIAAMVEGLTDWCISRQRSWGVPIPIFLCRGCDRPLLQQEVFDRVAAIFKVEGSDAWWRRSAEELLPPNVSCPQCGGTEFVQETDIMDVWFDSGSSNIGVLETHPDLRWPSDLYLEGSDQHRGWFKSSLLCAVVARGGAPYRQVLTHGFTVDEQGRKMSKSLGNGVDPMEVCREYGADVLRLWVASTDYRNDMPLSPNILKQVVDVYRKLRNTMRFLLGNLAGFDSLTDAVQEADLLPIDRWAMHRLQETVTTVLSAYEAYEYHTVYHTLNRFATVDISSIYLDTLKDRLYCERADGPERRAAQTVLYHTLDALIRLLAPILTFTTEEAWRHLPKPAGAPLTVQMLEMPRIGSQYLDESAAADWEQLLAVRETVAKALELARAAREIGSPQDALVYLSTPDTALNHVLSKYVDLLPGLCIVSEIRLAAGPDGQRPAGLYTATGPAGLKAVVVRAEGDKCRRCWYYRPLGTVAAHPDLCARCAAVVSHPNTP